MPSQSLSLDSKLFDVAKTNELNGVTVPWEATSFTDDFEMAESTGGFFDLSAWGVVEISGPDALDYLNRMTTQNFKSFPDDKIVPAAFLTGKGGVVVMGYFQKVGDGYHFLVPPGQVAKAVEHIETFHFSENFTATDKSGDWTLFALWKPFFDLKEDFEFPADGMKAFKVEWRRWRSQSLEFWQDNRREDLFWVKLSRKDAQIFFGEMKKLGVPLLGQRLFEYFRLRAGVPVGGLEIGSDDIILEANFDEVVARNKGCYPGQEVVERIFTYGSVNRKLLRVEIDRDDNVSFPKSQSKLFDAENKEVGTLVSYEEDPEDPQRAFGLAFVHKNYWNYDNDFTCGEGVVIRLSDIHENPL